MDTQTLLLAAAGATGGGGGPVFPARDHFNTVLYTGTGSIQSITGVGFQPDIVWIKSRGGSTNHFFFNVVSGAQNYVQPNTRAVEAADSTTVTAYNADGFSLGASSNVNASGVNYVAWCWKCGGTSVTNTDGTNTSQISANTTSGVCVFEYTGTGGVDTVGHGLGITPDFIALRPNVDSEWLIYHSAPANPSKYYIFTSLSELTNTIPWNNTAPTSTVFTVNRPSGTWTNGFTNYVGFAFASVAGFSSFGGYTGNGSATGPTITTDFLPSMVWIKRRDTTGDWVILDSARDASNPRNAYLEISGSPSIAEATGNDVDFNATGFQIKSTSAEINANGGTYLYCAFA